MELPESNLICDRHLKPLVVVLKTYYNGKVTDKKYGCPVCGSPWMSIGFTPMLYLKGLRKSGPWSFKI